MRETMIKARIEKRTWVLARVIEPAKTLSTGIITMRDQYFPDSPSLIGALTI